MNHPKRAQITRANINQDSSLAPMLNELADLSEQGAVDFGDMTTAARLDAYRKEIATLKKERKVRENAYVILAREHIFKDHALENYEATVKLLNEQLVTRDKRIEALRQALYGVQLNSKVKDPHFVCAVDALTADDRAAR